MEENFLMNGNSIKLRDIFCLPKGKEWFTRSELLTFDLNPDFVVRLCKHLKLDLDETAAATNVCFANSPEVRADFRTTFNKLDIINFIVGEYPAGKTYFRTTEILFPGDPISFWTAIAPV